jgi:hypothetical protein
MKTPPKVGTTGEQRFVVEAKHAIDFASGGMPAVLSTPWLIWFLEHAAREAVLSLLSAIAPWGLTSMVPEATPHQHSMWPKQGDRTEPARGCQDSRMRLRMREDELEIGTAETACFQGSAGASGPVSKTGPLGSILLEPWSGEWVASRGKRFSRWRSTRQASGNLRVLQCPG